MLCGEGYVGKTTIRERYIGIKFRSNYLQTIGADFTTRLQELDDGRQLKLQIWDLAGQQAFSSIRESFYKGADGIVLIYDVSQPHTSEKLFDWLKEIEKVVRQTLPIVLVANKIDLRGKVSPSIDSNQGQIIAEKMENLTSVSIPYIESSALTGQNIDTIFSTLANNIVDFKLETKKPHERDDMKTYVNQTSEVIDLYFFKMTQAGPVCITQTKKNPDQVLLFKMAIFYSTTLGQGDNAHTGLFGPVPIPESKDDEKFKNLQSILYSFEKPDENHHDPRAKGINFCFIVITVPEDILFQFNNKNIVIRLFHEEISKLKDVKEINLKFLETLKEELLKNVYLANKT